MFSAQLKKMFFSALFTISCISPCYSNTLEPSETVKVLVKDVGVMGLASHDLFAWDHKKKINKENGRLDLSTIFGNSHSGIYTDGDDWYEQKNWRSGGNKKNSENAPVYTVTRQLIQEFENNLSKGMDPDAARLATLKMFHAMVEESFVRLTTLAYPKSFQSNESVNNLEQASMRILHDILPGQILLKNGQFFDVTRYQGAKTLLCDDEMNCSVKTYDGDYDPEYKAIKIPVIRWLGVTFKLNLQNIDRKFIANAGMNPQQAAAQLKKVGAGTLQMSDTFFAPHLLALFSKAQSSLNTDDTTNIWTLQTTKMNASLK